ncbi:MAG: sigma-54-dependent Fis family transcriptional regulator [Acetobacteraceae bacterium]|nr:sigma-54-dependent Fis family transcriptional regulator [Acetobacteraceae bacterium]
MRILIVGSLSGELGQAGRIAIARGAKLAQADDVADALAQLRAQGGADIVMVDVRLDVAGLVRAMSAERIACPVVACGIGNDVQAAVGAIRAGAKEYLPLPPEPDLIAAMLEAVGAESHALIHRDPVMKQAIRRAEQVAASEASILVAGESGTGKEVLARHIHRKSRRSGGPFVALNCAAIPDNLLESELFGHEKGAFSGAIARRIGKFEAASGGTLLLDEISEMDVRLQAKLLRAIQEREIDRLGGAEPVKVNVRIIATSNRELPAEVAKGTFREDLYFRLNVVALRVPSLRERPADIAPLAEYFARKYADVNGLPFRPLSAAALALLESHSWRGNVRELENTIHRAVLLSSGEMIAAEAMELGGPVEARQMMSAAVAAAPRTPAMPAAPSFAGDGVAALVGRTVGDVERDLILETLTHCLGNRTHAATILGISIRTLRNKLREYSDAGLRVPPPQAGDLRAISLSERLSA